MSRAAWRAGTPAACTGRWRLLLRRFDLLGVEHRANSSFADLPLRASGLRLGRRVAGLVLVHLEATLAGRHVDQQFRAFDHALPLADDHLAADDSRVGADIEVGPVARGRAAIARVDDDLLARLDLGELRALRGSGRGGGGLALRQPEPRLSGIARGQLGGAHHEGPLPGDNASLEHRHPALVQNVERIGLDIDRRLGVRLEGRAEHRRALG